MYRLGDLSQVYPIARGLAPLGPFGLLVLASALQLAGVLLWFLAGGARWTRLLGGLSIALGILTGAVIMRRATD